jgi:YfiH family protein
VEAADHAAVALVVRERVSLTPGVAVTVTGRAIDPDEIGTRFGRSNLADHVGDDPHLVAARRALLAAQVGVDADHLVFARAEHGTALIPLTDASDTERAGDGVITSAHDLALMAMAADCVPFAVADRSSATFAAVHAGWRGTAGGIVRSVMEAFSRATGDETFDPRALSVYLGPAVCGRCYPVGTDVLDALRPVTPGDSWITDLGAAGTGVDLRDCLTAQFEAAGVPRESIARSAACTVEDLGLFSHRRDGAYGTGRHALVVHRTAV